MTPPRPLNLTGAILGGRYEILEPVGEGGMGIVFKARHVVLESLVAVKVLRKAQDEEAERRFLQEAKLASKIHHPNTVHISDFGVLEDGRSYLVMEFLQGPTLNVAIDEERLDPLRTCKIALQIVHGLTAVHSQGIVHRDLKPHEVTTKGDSSDIVPQQPRSACVSTGKFAERCLMSQPAGLPLHMPMHSCLSG